MAKKLPAVDWSLLPLLLTNELVAQVLSKAVRTVQDDATRAPWRLPPRVAIEGSNSVRYDRDAFRRWLEERIVGDIPNPVFSPRPGRSKGTTVEAMRARRECQRKAASEGVV
ncbi:hypothetical protein [Solilutibacter silvestris]|uniref:hypothetical protein n=1 Tax=Solilutibacter silvestris TaxID=1645665 RepID=UPI00197C0B9D|nr:hypothetical protein [Lysobacter silvestris]